MDNNTQQKEVTGPSVALIAATQPRDGISTPLKMVENIARLCTEKKEAKEPGRLFKYLIENSHWSPMEHNYYTFQITTSRAIGSQLLRHRSFTFQELSQRYTEGTKYQPFEFRMKSQDKKQVSREDSELNEDERNRLALVCHDAFFALDLILRIYTCLIANGVAPETARMILPECTQTKIIMTGSLRSWIHFLKIRMEPSKSNAPQKEIRMIAKMIYDILTFEIPEIKPLFE